MLAAHLFFSSPASAITFISSHLHNSYAATWRRGSTQFSLKSEDFSECTGFESHTKSVFNASNLIRKIKGNSWDLWHCSALIFSKLKAPCALLDFPQRQRVLHHRDTPCCFSALCDFPKNFFSKFFFTHSLVF